jgi:hypothetical protein
LLGLDFYPLVCFSKIGSLTTIVKAKKKVQLQKIVQKGICRGHKDASMLDDNRLLSQDKLNASKDTG